MIGRYDNDVDSDMITLTFLYFEAIVSFIIGLCNDFFNYSVYIGSNDWLICE